MTRYLIPKEKQDYYFTIAGIILSSKDVTSYNHCRLYNGRQIHLCDYFYGCKPDVESHVYIDNIGNWVGSRQPLYELLYRIDNGLEL